MSNVGHAQFKVLFHLYHLCIRARKMFRIFCMPKLKFCMMNQDCACRRETWLAASPFDAILAVQVCQPWKPDGDMLQDSPLKFWIIVFWGQPARPHAKKFCAPLFDNEVYFGSVTSFLSYSEYSKSVIWLQRKLTIPVWQCCKMSHNSPAPGTLILHLP